MKRKALKELHLKSPAELTELLKKTQMEFVKMGMELRLGKIKNWRILATKRHEIAQIKSIAKIKETI
jgi:ribosomal protein L29